MLGKEQQTALNQILEFLNNKEEQCFLIKGGPGRGKSFLLGEIIKSIKGKISYCLCAPTHKAALVMQDFTGENAITLHKLLSLSPKLDILELDFRELRFNQGNKNEIPFEGLVICDEASMINDDLYKLLTTKCAEYYSKILFIGDFDQLSPVKQDYISLVSKVKCQCELTKNYRQSENNPILPLLDSLKESCIDRFSSLEGSDNNVIVTEDTKYFMQLALKDWREALENKNILRTKIAAWTNSRVNSYNNTIHSIIYKDLEYGLGEIVTCKENLEFNNFKFYNCMDYVIIEEPKQIDIHIPDFGTFPGWRLVLYDFLENRSASISILSKTVPDNIYESLAIKLEDIRITAIQSPKYRAKNYWRKYYKILNSFTTPKNLYHDNRLIRKCSFTYGYASTVHLLQGTSLESIFIDMKDINKCKDDLNRRQLQYVGLSRTKGNAYILQ